MAFTRVYNVYKLMMISVCVHQCVREGGREYNQHILHRTLLVNNGWLDFSKFTVFVEFSADEHGLNSGLDF